MRKVTFWRMRRRYEDWRILQKERLRSIFAVPHAKPLLIFGNQKSGTSAIAGLIGAAAGQRVQIDIWGAREPFLTPLLRGQTSVARFVQQNAWPFSAPIIKEPSLTFVATELLDHFGCDKGLFIVRNPYQNIRSILNRLNVPGHLDNFTPTSRNLPNKTWRSIVQGSDLGFEPDHYIAIQAKRWTRACEVYLKDPQRYVLVRYEDFNANKREEIIELLTLFGLSCDRPFETLLDHQFQKKGRPGVDIGAFFGEQNVARIREICGPCASRFGYDS